MLLLLNDDVNVLTANNVKRSISDFRLLFTIKLLHYRVDDKGGVEHNLEWSRSHRGS